MIMFTKHSTEGYGCRIPGIDQKTLVYGAKTLMAEFLMKKGAILPRHSHPYEQTGYLVSGRILLSAGNEIVDCRPGDSWCIPMNVEHSAEIPEDSVVVEIFAPVRKDYLPNGKS